MPPGYPIGGITAYGNLMSDYWHAPRRPRAGARLLLPGQRAAAAVPHRSGAAARRWQTLAERREPASAGPRRSVEQDDDGVRVTIAEEDGGGQRRAGGRLRGRLRRRPFAGARADRHRARRHRFRPAHGAGRVPLARAARGSQALSRAHDLSRDASRSQGLLAVLRPHRRRRGLLLPCAGAGRHHARTTSISRRCCRRPPASSSPCEFDHVGFWDLRVAVARQYQVGRVFIAGDAAHSHPPYGGFGLNNGLEDAANLGWKLAATLRAGAARRCCASYSEERRPIFQETAEDFIAERIERRRRLPRPLQPGARPRRVRARVDGARDRRRRPRAGLRAALRGLAGGDRAAGRRVAAPTASTRSRRGPAIICRRSSCRSGRNVFEELGRGFTLLAFDADDAAVRGVRAGGAHR